MHLKPLQNRHLKTLASLKTGIVLMVALAGVSIFATTLEYERSLRAVFHTWWFRALLLLLVANLLFCTYQTLAKRVLPALRAPIPKSSEFYTEGALRFQFDTSHSVDEIGAILRRRGYRLHRQGNYFRARKGLSRLFAAPVAHAGFAVLLLGAFASGFLAFNGRIRLPEGGSTNEMMLADGPIRSWPLGFEVRCLDFETGTFPQTQIPSRFTSTLEVRDGDSRFVDTVEVNKSLKYRGLRFHQTSYGEVPGKKRYRVSVADTRTSIATEAVATLKERVPIPDWGRDLLLDRSIAGIRYSVLNGESVEASDFLGQNASAVQIKAIRFVPDFVVDASRGVMSRSEELNNPALQLAWLQGDEVLSTKWLFLRPELRRFSHGSKEPTRFELQGIAPVAQGQFRFDLAVYDSATDALVGQFSINLGDTVSYSDLAAQSESTEPDGTTGTVTAAAAEPPRFAVALLGTEPLFYTDLSISHNPMIPVIYLGAILGCLGICFALYLRRTTLWVWCQNPNGKVCVAVQYAPDRETLTPGVEKTLEALE